MKIPVCVMRSVVLIKEWLFGDLLFCGLPTVDCRLWTADCGLPTVDCRLKNAKYKEINHYQAINIEININ